MTPRNTKNKNRADEPSLDDTPRTSGQGDQNSPGSPDETDDAATRKHKGTPGREPLESRLETAVAERDANYERWVRAQAELENFRKRMQKEADEGRKYATLTLVRELLPGLDNLGRAIDAAKASGNIDELAQGVQMVARQFEEVLSKHGVVPIEAAGSTFDPNRHEALQYVPSHEQPAMTVLQEVERGYMLNDRVVRPSKVIVSSGPPESNDGREEGDE